MQPRNGHSHELYPIHTYTHIKNKLLDTILYTHYTSVERQAASVPGLLRVRGQGSRVVGKGGLAIYRYLYVRSCLLKPFVPSGPRGCRRMATLGPVEVLTICGGLWTIKKYKLIVQSQKNTQTFILLFHIASSMSTSIWD